MKAVQFDTYGGPGVLKLQEVAAPAPAADGVVIDVYAASMNPIDWKVRSGRMANVMPLAFPAAGQATVMVTQVSLREWTAETLAEIAGEVKP